MLMSPRLVFCAVSFDPLRGLSSRENSTIETEFGKDIHRHRPKVASWQDVTPVLVPGETDGRGKSNEAGRADDQCGGAEAHQGGDTGYRKHEN